MGVDRLELQEERLARAIADAVREAPPGGGAAWAGPDAATTRAILRAQLESRALDIAARRLRAEGRGYYTIASAGHEQNALLGWLLEPDDPCLLHYRSGALVLARAHKAGHPDILRDLLLSLCAGRDDPIAQGRHKVWGSRPLWIIPQTSTIASQLPKAVGLAFALSRCRRLGLAPPVSEQAIVVCSFGDASANHATALAAIQAARYAHRRGHALPILFVCEDNGLGISERSPEGWIADSFGRLPGLGFVQAAGDLDAVWQSTLHAIDWCRRSRSPVFLQLETVRLGGHAGSDAEAAYLSPSEIARMEAADPLLRNGRLAIARGLIERDSLARLHREVHAEVARLAQSVAGAPQLGSAAEIVAPLPPLRVHAAAAPAPRSPAQPALEPATGLTLGAQLNRALAGLLERRPEALVFGEDVGRKGGVYGITAGLQRRFGTARVFDTQLDETTILGTAQGLALAGLLPIPEIQYLAYVHNAIDQLRGEACSLSFFSSGQFRNPMVVRMAAFAYQKGFGGHFHNDNAIGALREIPGLALAAPAFGDDAARMLRGAVRLAQEEGRVVVFLEPIALYFERDLHQPGDGLWLRAEPEATAMLRPGEIGVYGERDRGPADLVLVSYANGLRLCLRAAHTLAARHGLCVRTLDLRWLAPLPWPALHEAAAGARALLVVDECRASGGGVAQAIVAGLAEAGHPGALGSLCAEDSYVPLGPAAQAVLVGEPAILERALRLLDAAPRRASRAG